MRNQQMFSIVTLIAVIALQLVECAAQKLALYSGRGGLGTRLHRNNQLRRYNLGSQLTLQLLLMVLSARHCTKVLCETL